MGQVGAGVRVGGTMGISHGVGKQGLNVGVSISVVHRCCVGSYQQV